MRNPHCENRIRPMSVFGQPYRTQPPALCNTAHDNNNNNNNNNNNYDNNNNSYNNK